MAPVMCSVTEKKYADYARSATSRKKNAKKMCKLPQVMTSNLLEQSIKPIYKVEGCH